jgi:hypothetical protein
VQRRKSTFRIVLQGWDTVQAFASSISGGLATAAVLEVCPSIHFSFNFLLLNLVI